MYEHFFGLKEKPFALLPDPSYLYMSAGHTRALTLLRYSLVGRQGFSVITGDVGSGKTTLINRLLEDMGNEATIGLLNFTDPGAVDLNEWVAMAFGLEYQGKSRVQLYEDFIAFLINQYAQGKYTVLIIDEAQNLIFSGLEKVRMLSNVNAQKEHLLHLILVGQPQLRDLLNAPDLEQLRQRVTVSYHLGPLSPEDAEQYVVHRLRVAGATTEIFSPAAMRMLAAESRGVPRVLNTLFDLALVYGFSANKKLIDEKLASEVLADRATMGLSLVDGPSSDEDSPSVDPGARLHR